MNMADRFGSGRSKRAVFGCLAFCLSLFVVPHGFAASQTRYAGVCVSDNTVGNVAWINVGNAAEWIEAGASHVIVTSWLFDAEGNFLEERAEALVAEVGLERVVLDLSCRRVENGWRVAMNRWQTPTDLVLDAGTLNELAHSCDEFLIHAADVEGKCEGIDARLVEFLGAHATIPVTYAGGVHALEDLQTVQDLSAGKVDLTIGSALDLFGISRHLLF